MRLIQVIEMVAMVARCSTMAHKRHPVDVLSDRLRQAMTADTLVCAMERLVTAMDVDSVGMQPQVIQGFLDAAASPQGKAVHAWLRKHPRFGAMIATLATHEERAAACSGIPLVDDDKVMGKVTPMRPYDIGMEVTCLSQLAHGADTKAGNATLFRRQDVLTDTGAVLELPFYAANAIRGQIRDCLADHFLESLGLGTQRDKPVVEQWFFQAIYSGGALEEKGSATMKKLSKTMGSNSAIRTEGIRLFRDHLPGLSVLGCSIGNKILPGRIQVGDLRPVSKEWGTGETPVSQLTTWTFLTRRDDRENKGAEDEHSGMIATTEVLKAGTVMLGGIDLDQHASPLERSALAQGLLLLQARGILGAECRRGLGRVQIEYTNLGSPDLYQAFLSEKGQEIKEFLVSIGGLNAEAAA
jgi:hypothetical protein